MMKNNKKYFSPAQPPLSLLQAAFCIPGLIRQILAAQKAGQTPQQSSAIFTLYRRLLALQQMVRQLSAGISKAHNLPLSVKQALNVPLVPVRLKTLTPPALATAKALPLTHIQARQLGQPPTHAATGRSLRPVWGLTQFQPGQPPPYPPMVPALS